MLSPSLCMESSESEVTDMSHGSKMGNTKLLSIVGTYSVTRSLSPSLPRYAEKGTNSAACMKTIGLMSATKPDRKSRPNGTVC